jgi:hypothetical protein
MAVLFAQRRDFLAELSLLQRVQQQHLQFGCLERFADEIGGAELHGLHDHARASLARDDDDRHVVVDFLEGCERRQAVHGAGHDHVEQDGGRTLRMKATDGLVGVRHRQRAVSSIAEERAEHPAHRQVVVDYHHLLLFTHRAPVLSTCGFTPAEVTRTPMSK